jgi:hypothetical protein
MPIIKLGLRNFKVNFKVNPTCSVSGRLLSAFGFLLEIYFCSEKHIFWVFARNIYWVLRRKAPLRSATGAKRPLMCKKYNILLFCLSERLQEILLFCLSERLQEILLFCLSERLQEILLFCFDSLELAELLLYFGFC